MRDVALGLLVLVLAQVEVWSSAPSSVRVVAAICAVVAGIALIWRRVLPITSAVVALAAIEVVDARTATEGVWPIAVLIIVMYSAARYASTLPAVALLAVGLVGDATTVRGEASSSIGEWLLNYAFIALLMVAGPWTVGCLLRRRELQSLELAAAAVGDERIRIARELHDIVGQSLGVIAVQASAERATLPDDAAESTRQTLLTIETTTREALVEMRRLVSMMRGSDPLGDPPPPQPTLAEVDAILDAARLAGWSTELHVEGVPARLAAGVELAAYRIVQEAVTNAIRHSHGQHATVTIRYLPGAVQVEVTDDGRSTAQAQTGGHGMTGMRERAALYGGKVTTERTTAGGFVIRANLPLVSGDV